MLFAGIAPEQVTRTVLPREDWESWVSRRAGDERKVLGWSLERGLFETQTIPEGELLRFDPFLPAAARGAIDPNITIITIAPSQ
jgi:hypothetical protein